MWTARATPGLLLAGLCVLGVLWPAPAAAAATAQAGASAASLPAVRLTTTRAIRDEPKVRVRVRLRRPSGGYDGWGAIETRGQSSQSFPKKSFALELRDRRGGSRDAGLLGMAADDDWILYAAYNDKSLMRNVVGYAAARATGWWAAATRFVEVFHNGRYLGVYVLMERPELSGARLDVPGAGITGDYLLEFTFPFQARQKGPYFRTPVRRRPIVWEDPERDDLTAAEQRYVRRTVARVERALYSGRRGAWREVLEPRAAVDYVLVQELLRNVDAFHGSTFLLKPAGQKLRLGPVWDFDLSTGNSTAPGSRSTTGWWTASRDWASRLHRDPTFRSALRARWRALRATGFRRTVLRALDGAAAAVRPAVDRNFRRWPILWQRVWPNPVARGSWSAEVRALRGWLIARMNWMDRATNSDRRS